MHCLQTMFRLTKRIDGDKSCKTVTLPSRTQTRHESSLLSSTHNELETVIYLSNIVCDQVTSLCSKVLAGRTDATSYRGTRTNSNMADIWTRILEASQSPRLT